MKGLFQIVGAVVGSGVGAVSGVAWYDAWELENVTNPELVRPLRRGCWFVRNKDYNAYNTLAVVDTLQKRYDEKDMMTEAEILAARAPAAPTPDAVTNRSRKGRKIQRK